MAGHPVILSVLFDRDGVLRGLRFVTDPRAAPHERAHGASAAALGSSTATIRTAGPAPTFRRRGRNAGRRNFHQAALRESSADRHLSVEARFLRKPGQSDVDPETGDYRAGQFESWTRFEIFDPTYW